MPLWPIGIRQVGARYCSSGLGHGSPAALSFLDFFISDGLDELIRHIALIGPEQEKLLLEILVATQKKRITLVNSQSIKSRAGQKIGLLEIGATDFLAYWATLRYAPFVQIHHAHISQVDDIVLHYLNLERDGTEI